MKLSYTHLAYENYGVAGTGEVHLADISTLGVVGDNGTGKSTIADMFRLAFTGTTAHSRGLPGLKSWSDEIEGFFSVTLSALNDKEEEVVIVRKGATNSRGKVTSSASVTVGGVAVATTPGKVNDWFASIGIRKEVVINNMIVEQGELHTVLFTEPEVRRKGWIKTCNLKYMSKAYEDIAAYIGTLPPIEDYQLLLDTSKEALELQTTAAADTAATLAAMVDPGDTGPQLSVFLSSQTTAAIAASTSTVAHDSAVLESDNATAAHKLLAPADVVAIGALSTKIATAEAAIADTNAGIARFDAHSNAHAAVFNLPDAIGPGDVPMVTAAITTATANLVEMRKVLGQLTTKKSAAQQQVNSIGTAADGGDCPTCGQSVTPDADLVAKLSDAKKELATLTAGVSKINDLIIAESVTETGKRSELTALEAKVRNRAAAEAALTAASVNVPPARPNTVDMASELAGLVQQQTVMTAATAAFHGSSSRMATAAATLEVTVAAKAVAATNLEDVVGKIKALGFDPAADLATTAVTLKEQKTVYDAAATAAKASASNVVTAQGAVDRANGSIAGQAAEQRKRDVLLQVKEETKALSVKVVATILEACTATVNKFLEDFDALFRVEAAVDEMSFRYYYPDGRPCGHGDESPSVRELSGGEKVVMACAFRFATYVMFSRDTGLLVLDEPTVYLDRANVNKFSQIIPKLKDTADSLGAKLIMATHERQCIPFLDAIVDRGTKEIE